MKTRRVVVTIEMDTDWSLKDLKATLLSGIFPGAAVARQVQTNIIKPAAKKPKK